MIFWILIFDPNWPFCQGYSVCMIADFQNCLMSGIIGVFSIGFLHRTTLMWLKNRSSHVFLNLNFWRKLTILPRHDDRFLNSSHLWNIWCFLQRLFAQNNSNVIKESFFAWFSEFLFLTQTDNFPEAIAFARWPIFKIAHCWNIWCFLTWFFAQSNSNVIREIVFRMFFLILVFDLKWPFCQGYSLCTMADF